MKYEYAASEHGVISDGQAKPVGKELGRIEKKHGSLEPKIVVDEARPAAATLHPFFTWDDKAAAEKHRLNEARRLISSVLIIPTQKNGNATPVRAFVNVHSTATETKFQGRSYISTVKAMREEDYRAQVLQEALNELNSWKKRYDHLKEFDSVFQAINATGELIQAE